MPSVKIGYARVSTIDQCLDAQIEELTKAGAEKIFSERYSGKSKEERAQLKACLDYIREGDILLVTKIDRLARNAIDLLNIYKGLKKKGVEVIFLQNKIDTTTSMGECMLTMLAAFAQLERDMINERSQAGMKRAREMGIKTGRKCKDGTIKFIDADEVKRLYNEENKTIKDLTVKYGCTRQTIYNYLKDKIPKVNEFMKK